MVVNYRVGIIDYPYVVSMEEVGAVGRKVGKEKRRKKKRKEKRLEEKNFLMGDKREE
jgi:hypothetical protein